MIEIQLYKNLSDDRTINKILSPTATLLGEVRDSASVMTPVILCELTSLPTENYAYIPAFNRYYFITDITAYRDRLYYISFYVDVLMTYKQDILQLTAIIERQAMPDNYNAYIDDGTFAVENSYDVSTIVFPNGFQENPAIMLITAG